VKTVNIHEAKTHLSRLVEQVEAGQEVTIARNGRPVAKLVPLTRDARPREPGSMRGRFTVPDDFDADLSAATLTDFLGAIEPVAGVKATGDKGSHW
jgi:prevent-host-death family protein